LFCFNYGFPYHVDIRLTCELNTYVCNIVDYGHAKFYSFMINAFCQKLRKYKFIIEYLKIAERWEGEGVERRWGAPAGNRVSTEYCQLAFFT
jgi:hypothetical protein